MPRGARNAGLSASPWPRVRMGKAHEIAVTTNRRTSPALRARCLKACSAGPPVALRNYPPLRRPDLAFPDVASVLGSATTAPQVAKAHPSPGYSSLGLRCRRHVLTQTTATASRPASCDAHETPLGRGGMIRSYSYIPEKSRADFVRASQSARRRRRRGRASGDNKSKCPRCGVGPKLRRFDIPALPHKITIERYRCIE
jgi:hypothetical protein